MISILPIRKNNETNGFDQFLKHLLSYKIKCCSIPDTLEKKHLIFTLLFCKYIIFY